MSRRQSQIHATSLQTLFAKHPYIGLFQKENWSDYLELLAQIYDYVEETGQQVPYEGVRVLTYKYFREKDLQSVEAKVSQFIIMCIEELKVLKDYHDASGRRMMELTRPGKQLLQMVEELLSQRVKYSGTGAETLLASLNEALTSGKGFTYESALTHHQEKIRAYKEDLNLIKDKGVEHAQLLPVAHSTEALFAQAEESAYDILAAVEDVKQAIEHERKKLAQSYLESSLSSGQSLNTVAEFYEQLHHSTTYKSYIQAKNIFSFLSGYGHLYPHKDIPKILRRLEVDGLIDQDVIHRSQLNGFQRQFEMADTAIQEKTRAQLQLLQLQVRYSLATDVKGLQSSLKDILQKAFENKEGIQEFFAKNGIQSESRNYELGQLELFSFENQPEIDEVLVEESFAENETRQLIEALLRAEETTLKQVVATFNERLQQSKTIKMVDYPFQYGLAEYYILSEIQLFSDDIEKTETEPCDLTLELKNNAIVIKNANCYEYKLRSANGFESHT